MATGVIVFKQKRNKNWLLESKWSWLDRIIFWFCPNKENEECSSALCSFQDFIFEVVVYSKRDMRFLRELRRITGEARKREQEKLELIRGVEWA